MLYRGGDVGGVSVAALVSAVYEPTDDERGQDHECSDGPSHGDLLRRHDVTRIGGRCQARLGGRAGWPQRTLCAADADVLDAAWIGGLGCRADGGGLERP